VNIIPVTLESWALLNRNVLPILSDVTNFSVTYIIALTILVIGKSTPQYPAFLIGATLVYLLAIGFIPSSLQKICKMLKPLPSQRIQHIITLLKYMITENLSSTAILVSHILASIIVIGITLKIFIAIARLQIKSMHELINAISSKLPTVFTTLTTVLYLASIIGTGVATLKLIRTRNITDEQEQTK